MVDFESHPALMEVRRRAREAEAAYRAYKEVLDRELKSGDPRIWEAGEKNRLDLRSRVDEANAAFNEAHARWKPIKKELEWAELRRFFRFWKR
jgi:hypothetical protein